MHRYKNKLTPFSQSLRKNMTREERHLWYDFFKLLPYTVKRQKIIDKYIVDFCIPEFKLIIEVDGSQHYESPGKNDDMARDMYLAERGFVVLRYSNREINQQFDSVCQDILNSINRLK